MELLLETANETPQCKVYVYTRTPTAKVYTHPHPCTYEDAFMQAYTNVKCLCSHDVTPYSQRSRFYVADVRRQPIRRVVVVTCTPGMF